VNELPAYVCYHIFRLTDAFMEVVENGIYLTHEVLSPPLPPHLRRNAELVVYGREVQQRLRAWWAGFEGKDCIQEIDNYYGKQPLHNVLERHTWHPAQHVRQLMLLLQDDGIEPDGPLDDSHDEKPSLDLRRYAPRRTSPRLAPASLVQAVSSSVASFRMASRFNVPVAPQPLVPAGMAGRIDRFVLRRECQHRAVARHRVCF